MARYTLVTVTDTIEELRDKETVYKTEVDSLKYAFSHAFEADIKSIREQYTHSGKWQNLSEAESAVEGAMPYEARHWYGKKFSQILEEAPETAFVDAVRSHRNRWRPLFNAMQDLIKRQTKGRKPVESTKKVIGTRTQLRAICPACFKEHAVQNDRLVAHGYTLDYGFQNGTCRGAGKKHFGTTEGVQFTQDLIRQVRKEAETAAVRLEETKARTRRPLDRKGAVIEVPTARQWAVTEAGYESAIRNITYHADMLQKMVDGWKLQDPVEVEVEVTE